jgi:uncharacterized protein (TIGR02118 family)
MYRCSVLYGTPADPQAFTDYYNTTHIPIAKKMEGLTGWNLTWIDQSDNEGFPGIFLIADLYAADRASMDAILASPEGQAASADVAKFATGGAFFLFGSEEAVI